MKTTLFLFFTSLIFGAMFVLSSLGAFIEMLHTGDWSVLDPTTGHWSHYSTTIGMIGWIASTYLLVRVDE